MNECYAAELASGCRRSAASPSSSEFTSRDSTEFAGMMLFRFGRADANVIITVRRLLTAIEPRS
jgi:hypothetical protein